MSQSPRKAAALGHSLISNHPFVDGNKRAGHAAMEVILLLNGYELLSSHSDNVAGNLRQTSLVPGGSSERTRRV
jgi:death-on-curing family protein